MKVGKKHYRTIWISEDDPKTIKSIDQRHLPHKFVVEKLKTIDDFCKAIADMHVRGAGLIGAAAGYGMYVAALDAAKKCEGSVGKFNEMIKRDAERLMATRPTAVNLKWAVERMIEEMDVKDDPEGKAEIARKAAEEIADEDAENCRRIGEYGAQIIERIAEQKNGKTVNILTHCNAGWLAFVDYGTATAPIYAAHDKGIKVHVWVDETRPRNQGARLTAWELGQHGVPHTVISDNTGGHLMQHGMVDMVMVGSDRTTYTGDVANKVGTYLKALAAKDNNVPFFVALPSSTFDWEMRDGVMEIPIEERGADEVRFMRGAEPVGATAAGEAGEGGGEDPEIREILIMPKESKAANYAFDVTPARLVSALITERGVMRANEESILAFYPEKIKPDDQEADLGEEE